MKKIFVSGSCRLMTTISDGRGIVNSIHSMIRNFKGPNFLGKLHNTKQHIQFIKYLNDKIKIPEYILKEFLTSYSLMKGGTHDPISTIPIKKNNIKIDFYNCDAYIFEICSLKLYEKDGFQVQYEMSSNYQMREQTSNNLYNDLKKIRKMIPADEKIIFQTHFRYNIIHNNPKLAIKNREIIYQTVKKFCDQNENTFIHDPSVIFIENPNNSFLIDKNHFNPDGFITNFNFIYDNFILDKN